MYTKDQITEHIQSDSILSLLKIDLSEISFASRKLNHGMPHKTKADVHRNERSRENSNKLAQCMCIQIRLFAKKIKNKRQVLECK